MDELSAVIHFAVIHPVVTRIGRLVALLERDAERVLDDTLRVVGRLRPEEIPVPGVEVDAVVLAVGLEDVRRVVFRIERHREERDLVRVVPIGRIGLDSPQGGSQSRTDGRTAGVYERQHQVTIAGERRGRDRAVVERCRDRRFGDLLPVNRVWNPRFLDPLVVFGRWQDGPVAVTLGAVQGRTPRDGRADGRRAHCPQHRSSIERRICTVHDSRYLRLSVVKRCSDSRPVRSARTCLVVVR